MLLFCEDIPEEVLDSVGELDEGGGNINFTRFVGSDSCRRGHRFHFDPFHPSYFGVVDFVDGGEDDRGDDFDDDGSGSRVVVGVDLLTN